jgi:L-ascorbate metabolism protein UlaG (beta-lactamase superfamily)
MTILKRAEKQGRKFLNPVETRVGGIDMMWKILPLYLTNKEERVPKVPLGPFRTDASVYATPPASGLRVTWMGHSTTLVEIDGLCVLIDPVWDERASPARWFGPKRFFPAPLRLEEMPRLDAVLISHDHYDHLGRMTMERLAKLEAAKAARWVAPLEVGASLREFGVDAERVSELDWTEAIAIADGALTITALPTRHFSGRSLANRFETLWASYVLKGAKHTVYYGADSGLWEGFAEIGRTYGPFDLTMLEIGASNQLWSDIHLGPDGAVKAFRELTGELGGEGLLMPIHWGLFDLALHGWRQPIERMCELADKEGIRLWSPGPGAPTEVVSGEEVRSPWWRQVADSALAGSISTAAGRSAGPPLTSGQR